MDWLITFVTALALLVLLVTVWCRSLRSFLPAGHKASLS